MPREAAATFERLVLAFYDQTFLDIVLAPRELQPERYRRAIFSLLAGDVFDGGPPDAVAITQRFEAIAAMMREQAARMRAGSNG